MMRFPGKRQRSASGSEGVGWLRVDNEAASVPFGRGPFITYYVAVQRGRGAGRGTVWTRVIWSERMSSLSAVLKLFPSIYIFKPFCRSFHDEEGGWKGDSC